ncbi:MAG: cation:proton antiporter [Candidatus Micrarchaeota archaeon]|nr:cation:proton antiporter [Candidatus Micrarchaeota archaeon]
MIDVTFAFVLIAGIIFFGFGAEIFFRKTGVPYFLFLIFVGVLLGPVLNLLPRDAFIPVLGIFSEFTLMMVLFYNGMQMGIKDVISSSSRTLVQVALYVFVSVLAIAAVAHLAFGWDTIQALIFGSIIGGETTAPVMMRLSKTLKQDNSTVTFLGLESVMNSIFSVVLFFVFLSIYQTGSSSISAATASLSANISVGVIFGFALSLLWVLALNYLRNYRYTYVFTLGLLLTTFIAAQLSGGSGLMAVLVFGIILGNYKTVGSWLRRELKIEDLESQLRGFQDEVSFLLETFFFVFLGLTFLIQPTEIIFNLLAGALFVAVLLVIRYIAVNISTRGSSLYKNRRFITFMCAQGLTPAILSIVALADNLPLANQFVSIVVFVIVITNVITSIDAYFTMRKSKAGATEEKPNRAQVKKQDGGSSVTT